VKKLAIAATFCVLIAGCSVDELILSEGEQQDLADNIVGAIEAYQALADFALTVALGNADLAGSDYTEPSASNDWTGTLVYNGDQFPGGNGSMSMTFQVLADGVLVDPYNFDFSETQSITLDMSVQFNGTSAKGAPLSLDCNFTMDITPEEGVAAAVTINGGFLIGHNGYTANLGANNFALEFDAATETLTSITGTLIGTINIPEYAFDADLDIVGQGDRVDFSVAVSGGGINDSVAIEDLAS